MNIAVIDDNKKDLMSTVDAVREFFLRNWGLEKNKLSIDEFLSSDKFVSEYRTGNYQLVVSDIYMGNTSGIDSAKVMRRFHDDCHIIFVTNSQEHMLMGYEVFADGYIMKPLSNKENKQKLFMALEHCFGKKRDENIFKIRTATEVVEIPFDKLIFIEVGDKRHCIFHTTQSVFDGIIFYNDCKDIILSDSRFMECYHRMIVNMDYIEEMEGENFLLTTGERIPISRRKRSQVSHEYMNYLVGR